MSLADKLRQLNTEKEIERKIDEQLAIKAAEAQEVAWKLRAKSELEQLIPRLEKAARKGERRFIIHPKLEIGKDVSDYSGLPKSRDIVSDNHANGYWKYLYLECLKPEYGLKPIIQYQHDGCGIRDWYEFVITW